MRISTHNIRSHPIFLLVNHLHDKLCSGCFSRPCPWTGSAATSPGCHMMDQKWSCGESESPDHTLTCWTARIPIWALLFFNDGNPSWQTFALGSEVMVVSLLHMLQEPRLSQWGILNFWSMQHALKFIPWWHYVIKRPMHTLINGPA